MYRLRARHFGACESAAAELLKLEASTDQDIQRAVFLGDFDGLVLGLNGLCHFGSSRLRSR